MLFRSLEVSHQGEDLYLAEQISNSIQSGTCRAGVYFVNGILFDALDSTVERINLP